MYAVVYKTMREFLAQHIAIQHHLIYLSVVLFAFVAIFL